MPAARRKEPSVKSVRALERGLDVLLAIETKAGAGLKDLHDITGLPKATLLRILRTLMERNLIWQRMADGAYLAAHRRARSPQPDDSTRIVEIASPIMAELCAKVNWPSVLSVRRGGKMEVVETNRPRSYVPHLPLGPVGAQINMLLTSTGRAYFSFCGQEEREEITTLLRHSGEPDDQMAHDPAWLARLVAQVRAQGYAVRDPAMSGDGRWRSTLREDGRNSLSVPVIVDGQVRATLNITWTRRAATVTKIVADCLPEMRAAAAAMAAGLAAK